MLEFLSVISILMTNNGFLYVTFSPELIFDIDIELKTLMAQREEAKKIAVLSDSPKDRKLYCILRIDE